MSTNRLILFAAGGILIVGVIVAAVFLSQQDTNGFIGPDSANLTRETITVYRSPT